MARFVINPLRRERPDWSAPELGYLELIRTRAQLPLHRALPGYAPTPLHDLPGWPPNWAWAACWSRTSRRRFGIQAFKGLGASFAMYSVLRARWRELTGQDLAPAAFADPEVKPGSAPSPSPPPPTATTAAPWPGPPAASVSPR